MHGGAWCFGSKVWNAGPMTRWYLVCRGFIVVSIGYRFAPKHPWPAQLHCLAHAVRWIKNSYGEHEALPGCRTDSVPPIVLIGGSAGAHVSLTFALAQAVILSGAGADIHPEIRVPVQQALDDDARPLVWLQSFALLHAPNHSILTCPRLRNTRALLHFTRRRTCWTLSDLT